MLSLPERDRHRLYFRGSCLKLPSFILVFPLREDISEVRRRTMYNLDGKLVLCPLKWNVNEKQNSHQCVCVILHMDLISI